MPIDMGGASTAGVMAAVFAAVAVFGAAAAAASGEDSLAGLAGEAGGIDAAPGTSEPQP